MASFFLLFVERSLQFKVQLSYECFMVWRSRVDLVYPFLFLIITTSLFPLACDPWQLKIIAPSVFWVIVLFWLLINLQQLFYDEWQVGEIEQWLLHDMQLNLILFVKLCVFSFKLLLPIMVLIPFFMMLLAIPMSALSPLFLSLCLAIPTLVFLGGIARTLTLGLAQSSLLIALIVVPFYIPVLIFSTSTLLLASKGLPYLGCLAWLSIMALLSMSFSPFIIGKILHWGIME